MDYDDFQKLYVNVCDGFSLFKLKNKDIFVKHLNYSEKSQLREEYKKYINEAKTSGIMTLKDYTDLYIEKSYWSKQKESEIGSLKIYIENMQKSRGKLLLESQKKQIDELIIENQKKLEDLLNEKKSIIPFTAEEYAEKKYNRFFLYKSLFLDNQFKELFLQNPDDYLDLEDDVYSDLWRELIKLIDFTGIENIKLLAATGFFQNLIMVCGKDGVSPIDFYGKPLVNLTTNQIDLLSFALFYRRCINNATEKIPEDVLSSPEKLINWCESDSSSVAKARKILDKTPNKNKTRGERSGRITSIVGADKSDYNSLGISENSAKSVDLLSEAGKAGGTLSINQVIKKTD
jgi:hypothetical protein